MPQNQIIKHFYAVLINNLVSNVVTGYLWFALSFWVYLSTGSVLATGLLGGGYMLLAAAGSLIFGTFVDRHHKKNIMLFANVVTAVAFIVGSAVYVLALNGEQFSVADPMLWVYGLVILLGAVIGNMRNIAMSTTVTLLVPSERRDKANGLVGAISGVGFIVTSVMSGLSIGMLGMGWTLAIATVLMIAATIHMFFVAIPEKTIAHDPELAKKKVDIKGGWLAIMAVPGLVGLVFFSVFNNLIGGVFMALLDPYGLTLFSVEMWGIIFGVTGTGFIIGGLLVAKFGLGKKPLRSLMLSVALTGVIGVAFAIREIGWLLIVGIWVYMTLMPYAEAAEQTLLQKVVPFEKQGRVFGLAGALEAAAAPITSFLIAPVAEFWVIPAFRNLDTQAQWSWLLGTGQMRGVAMIFLVSGVLIFALSLLAMRTKSYRLLSRAYEEAKD